MQAAVGAGFSCPPAVHGGYMHLLGFGGGSPLHDARRSSRNSHINAHEASQSSEPRVIPAATIALGPAGSWVKH